jgi:hypothetical protein
VVWLCSRLRHADVPTDCERCDRTPTPFPVWLRLLLAASMRTWVSTMAESNASDLIGRSPGGRKLIAVVYTDMVGYSRLIGLDDAGTLQRLRTLRDTLIDPAIEEHGGRIVQTGGDSLLIVFDSIDGAVRCAVKVAVGSIISSISGTHRGRADSDPCRATPRHRLQRHRLHQAPRDHQQPPSPLLYHRAAKKRPLRATYG